VIWRFIGARAVSQTAERHAQRAVAAGPGRGARAGGAADTAEPALGYRRIQGEVLGPPKASGSVKCRVGELRSLLRFLYLQGLTPAAAGCGGAAGRGLTRHRRAEDYSRR
jgi:hypothetical protein